MSNKEYPTPKEREFNLQNRLITYSVSVIKLCESLPETRTGKHICSQLLRSGTSPAPNYGEAQGAESRADFIHKLAIALKELRETDTWLKVIDQANLIQSRKSITPLLRETNELISILFSSIQTARNNPSR